MDSTAALIWAVQQGYAVTALNCFSETEHPETRAYLLEICSLLGVRLLQREVTGSLKHFVLCIRESKDYLSAFNRFYDRQYHRPYRALIQAGDYNATVLGYRRAEHQFLNGRSRLRRLVPVYDWSKSQIQEFVAAAGLRLHPCYSQTEFLDRPVRESGWIDMDGYGLFHLAGNESNTLHPEAERTLLWLNRYYPHLFQTVIKEFPKVVERLRDHSMAKASR